MQQAKDHLSSKYVSFMCPSPILFTAPHSKQLKRQGWPDHKKESLTSMLACDLAIQTGSNSFVFWGTSEGNQSDLDPNYLTKSNFADSPFHQSLHAWALQNQGQPLLHIDIHGKADRSYNCEIEVGIRSMEVHWPNDSLIQGIRKFFLEYQNIFAGYKFGDFQCQINTDPSLHGYWGSGVHTMTEQAIMLGIPSLQLQLPLQVRKTLAFDRKLLKKFAELIRKIYEKVIKPDYQKNPKQYNVSKDIGGKFKSTLSKKQVGEASNQIYELQTKGPIPIETIY